MLLAGLYTLVWVGLTAYGAYDTWFVAHDDASLAMVPAIAATAPTSALLLAAVQPSSPGVGLTLLTLAGLVQTGLLYALVLLIGRATGRRGRR